MYSIGEFSKLAKTPIKTIRYYDEVGLLEPAEKDDWTGYRKYSAHQLVQLYKIQSLKSAGLSLDEAREVLNGGNLDEIIAAKQKQLAQVRDEIDSMRQHLTFLDQKKGITMKYQAIIKTIPEYTVVYKQGVIKSFPDLKEFVFSVAEECKQINPNIKCVEPNYSYISYLADKFQDHDIEIEYCDAVTKAGKDGPTTKFKVVPETEAIVVVHHGPWDAKKNCNCKNCQGNKKCIHMECGGLAAAYAFAMEYLEQNGYELSDHPRECYIDGPWNKKSPDDYVTEIQLPVKRR